MLFDKEIKLDLPFFINKNHNDYETAILLNSCDRGYGIFTMDDNSVFFFEKHISDVYNNSDSFTKMHLLVVLNIFFKMMEDGLYSVSKLKVILLHMMQIKSDDNSEEVIIDSLTKFW